MFLCIINLIQLCIYFISGCSLFNSREVGHQKRFLLLIEWAIKKSSLRHQVENLFLDGNEKAETFLDILRKTFTISQHEMKEQVHHLSYYTNKSRLNDSEEHLYEAIESPSSSANLRRIMLNQTNKKRCKTKSDDLSFPCSIKNEQIMTKNQFFTGF